MRPARLLVVVSISLAGCNAETPPPRPHTVIEFLKDEALLNRTWAACRNDPGGLGRTPECENAGHAKERWLILGPERAIAVLEGRG